MSLPYYNISKVERLNAIKEYRRTYVVTEDTQVRDVALSDLAEERKKWVVDWEANMHYMVEHETHVQEIEELMAGILKLSEEKEDDSEQWSTLSNASTSEYDSSIPTDSDCTESEDDSENEVEMVSGGIFFQ